MKPTIEGSFMKTLVKCKFYLITLFAAVLLMVGAAASDDQANLSIGESKQGAKKPTIMILGSTHLANDGLDYFNIKMDDVRIPKRRREVEQLVSQPQRSMIRSISFLLHL